MRPEISAGGSNPELILQKFFNKRSELIDIATCSAIARYFFNRFVLSELFSPEKIMSRFIIPAAVALKAINKIRELESLNSVKSYEDISSIDEKKYSELAALKKSVELFFLLPLKLVDAFLMLDLLKNFVSKNQFFIYFFIS